MSDVMVIVSVFGGLALAFIYWIYWCIGPQQRLPPAWKSAPPPRYVLPGPARRGRQ